MRKTDTIINLMENMLNEKELNHLKTVLNIVLQEQEDVPPMEDLEKSFKQSLKLTGRKDTSIAQYELELRLMQKYINKHPVDITTRDLKEYFSKYQEERNISMVTMTNKIRYCGSFFDYLLNEGYINKNPTKAIGRVIVPVKLKRAFSDQDIKLIRESCKILRDRAMVEFLLATGARVSECSRLRVCDIDFNTKEFVIFGKGHKERLACINDTASDWILKYLDERSPDLMEPLFSGIQVTTDPISSRGIEKVLARIGETANVTNVHPHRFRRTYATNLWRQGVPVETIKVLMGHSNIQTTLRYIDIDNTSVKESYVMASVV